MKNSYAYILTNWNNKVMYIGVTADLEKRVAEHKAKIIPGFTKRYNVNKLVYFECFSDITVAIVREKEIKGWRREKKNELVRQQNSNWIDLSTEWYKDASGALRRSG